MTTRGMLEAMLLDLLDGTKGPYEIHEQTGLPEERCQEIFDWYVDHAKLPEADRPSEKK